MSLNRDVTRRQIQCASKTGRRLWVVVQQETANSPQVYAGLLAKNRRLHWEFRAFSKFFDTGWALCLDESCILLQDPNSEIFPGSPLLRFKQFYGRVCL